MSFWRCCSTMAGSSASLAISASAPAMRSFRVAICWPAPAERVRLRQLALRLAPQLTQATLLALHRAQALGRLLGGGTGGVGRAAHTGLLARQRAKSAALGQARGGGGRHLRGGDEAVPAPQMAFAGDQALSGLEATLQTRAVRGVDDADLAQAARQLGGPRN